MIFSLVWLKPRSAALCPACQAKHKPAMLGRRRRGNVMRFPRRQFLQFAAGASALPFTPWMARADSYPNRSVRFIVPFPPGGASDPVARVLGGRLAEVW